MVLYEFEHRGNPVGAGQAPRFRVDGAPIGAAAAFSSGHVDEDQRAVAQHRDLGLGSRAGVDGPVRGVDVEAFRPGSVLIRPGQMEISGVVVVDPDGVVAPPLVLEGHGRTAFASDASGEGTAAVHRCTVGSGFSIPGQDALEGGVVAPFHGHPGVAFCIEGGRGHEVVLRGPGRNGDGFPPGHAAVRGQDGSASLGPLTRNLIAHDDQVPVDRHPRSFAVVDEQPGFLCDLHRGVKAVAIRPGAVQTATRSGFAVQDDGEAIRIEFHAKVVQPEFRGRHLDGVFPHNGLRMAG